MTRMARVKPPDECNHQTARLRQVAASFFGEASKKDHATLQALIVALIPALWPENGGHQEFSLSFGSVAGEIQLGVNISSQKG